MRARWRGDAFERRCAHLLIDDELEEVVRQHTQPLDGRHLRWRRIRPAAFVGKARHLKDRVGAALLDVRLVPRPAVVPCLVQPPPLLRCLHGVGELRTLS